MLYSSSPSLPIFVKMLLVFKIQKCGTSGKRKIACLRCKPAVGSQVNHLDSLLFSFFTRKLGENRARAPTEGGAHGLVV